MLLQPSRGWNVWYVNGNPVTGVVLHDGADILLEVKTPCLYRDGACTPFVSFDDITEVVDRRKFKIERPEHSLIKNILYINVTLFGGYGTVDEEPYQDRDGIYIHYRWKISVHMAVDGKPADWVNLMTPHYHRHDLTKKGKHAQLVADAYNSYVPDHTNRDISVTTAGRLIDILPQLAALASGAVE